MANRHQLNILSGAAALILLTSIAVQAAGARLPWTATSSVDFVQAVINADNYRGQAGGLAMKKSPSQDVREFGRAIWVDSIEDTRNLNWVLSQIDPHPFLPTTVAPKYLFIIDELLPVTGTEFDRRFIAQQAKSLTDALARAEGYARYGADFDLKEYAKRSAPKIRARLDQLHQIETRYQTASR
jgi:predicted outer membrane protein